MISPRFRSFAMERNINKNEWQICCLFKKDTSYFLLFFFWTVKFFFFSLANDANLASYVAKQNNNNFYLHFPWHMLGQVCWIHHWHTGQWSSYHLGGIQVHTQLSGYLHDYVDLQQTFCHSPLAQGHHNLFMKYTSMLLPSTSFKIQRKTIEDCPRKLTHFKEQRTYLHWIEHILGLACWIVHQHIV